MTQANSLAYCVDRGLQMQGCLCLPAWLLAVDNYRTTCGSCLELGPAFFFLCMRRQGFGNGLARANCLAFAICKNAVEGDDVTSTFMYILFWILNALWYIQTVDWDGQTTGMVTPRPMKANVTFSFAF